MGKATGIQISNDGDLFIQVKRNSGGVITSGLLVGNTLRQNQYMILKAQKGDLKEHPMLGCGIDDLSNDNNLAEWKKLIREEFAKDGMKVSQLSINTVTEELILKADYA